MKYTKITLITIAIIIATILLGYVGIIIGAMLNRCPSIISTPLYAHSCFKISLMLFLVSDNSDWLFVSMLLMSLARESMSSSSIPNALRIVLCLLETAWSSRYCPLLRRTISIFI